MARAAGFKVHYKNLYDLLQVSDVNQYDALFFLFSPRMIQMSLLHYIFSRFMCALSLNYSNFIPEHCWNLLRSFSNQHNKALAIILPGHITYSKLLKQQSMRTIERLGCCKNIGANSKQSIRDFITIITQPDVIKGALFGTSLIPSQNKNPVPQDTNSIMYFKTYNPKTKVLELATLPIDIASYSHLIQKSFPIGLLIRDDVRNITFLISKSSEFIFAEVSEHLFKNPSNIADRNELLQAAQETLTLFLSACTTQKIPEYSSRPPLDYRFSEITLRQKKEQIELEQKKMRDPSLYQWMDNKNISLAWLDPYDFYAHEDEHNVMRQLVPVQEQGTDFIKQQIEAIALERGVRLLYQAQFDVLWFEFVPEWYFSSRGIRKTQKEEYIQRIKKLGTTLKVFFLKRKMPRPKIFLGMNLTSNFKTNPPSNPVQDVYGNSYTKIPSPFDITDFWKPEVLDVFDTFITTFSKEFPIDGVCFDLEMYHAPEQTGMYTDLMDFSDITWNTYCSYTKNSTTQTLSSVKQRIRYLQREKKFSEYFKILEQASRDLGKTIKDYMRKKQPNLIFCAYAPTVPHSWFYRGLLAGLSSQSEPLLLATFNTDYLSHYNWLIKHGIYCVHGGALMLSKFKAEESFSIIPKLQTLHNFVWYNRPSRMIYGYNEEQLSSVWWGIEATSYDRNKTMEYIKSYHHA